MKKDELQALAELRLADAEALLGAGRWQAAYYLLGYCVECALKACVASQFRLHEVPERKLVNSFYTHQLAELLAISGLKSALHARASADPAFGTSWDTVAAWTEAVRYEAGITEPQARTLYDAVADPESGILPWLKILW